MWYSQQHITLFSGVLIGRDQLRYYSGHKTHGEHFDAWRTQRKFKLVRAKIPVHDDVESPGTVDKQVAFSAFVKDCLSCVANTLAGMPPSTLMTESTSSAS